ncbi:TAXI family TRAP transporter solute-binding subunit [Acetomicrobium sp. UBA5826]|uniref:TAXI family TRAP transporter solute-binding subunit n=1 Tax=Acetomicrobium sp. UBA5826 TaxID=1946039 RepID=UPI00257CE18C|nr:TAXI family TRAP transporter solute-binding subunit [Acetomicrobium sp. UBA5826]
MRVFMKVSMVLVVLMLTMGMSSNGGEAAGKVFIRIPTASMGGSFYPAGSVIASLINDKLGCEGIIASAQESGGSPENINMMSRGEAEAAVLITSVVVDACYGRGAFKDRPYKDVRMITILWPNVAQMVVTEKSGIKTFQDLKGQRISVGQLGSGTEPCTIAALAGAGMTYKDIIPEFLGFSQSVDAIRDGRIVAAQLSGGIPHPSVLELFASKAGVRLLSMSQEEIKRACELYPEFTEFTIPANTYPGQNYDVHTITTTTTLGIRKDIPEELVYKITKTIFENLDYIHMSYDALKYMSLEHALNGLVTPLHPGALRYFKECGLDIPEKLVPPECKE